MFFTLLNLSSKFPLSVKITLEKQHIEFTLGSLINKRNKEELNAVKQYELLNAYVDYKGDKFKEDLFKLYGKAEEDIMNSIMVKNLYPLPRKMIHDILDMFDMKDVFNYVKNIYGIKPPTNLMETFDQRIEEDGLGTRIQTYDRNDYYELASLTLPIKAVLGPIAQYGFVKQSEILSIHKEHMLFNLIDKHPIVDYPSTVKLRGLAEKLIELNITAGDMSAISVIEKQISRDDMPAYILSIILLQKVAVADIVTDNMNKNIITRMYNYVINKLKVKGDSSNRISEKKPSGGQDGDNDSKESSVEIFRVLSTLTQGNVEELDWSVSDINRLVTDMKIPLNSKIIYDAAIFTKKLQDQSPQPEQLSLLGVIFKDIIHPKGIEYITMESIINLMTVAFAYLWEIHHRELAILLLSVTDDVISNDTMSINTTVNRNRIPKELKEELQVYFPYERVINATTTASIVEESINEASNQFYTKRWVTIVPDSYIDQVLTGGKLDVLPSDLKVKLAEFYITHEQILSKEEQ